MKFKPVDKLDQLTREKWRSKKDFSKERNRDFALTYEQYKSLLSDAGITANDIGIGEDDYCLARHKDLGGYTIGNCRFITNKENRLEQIESGKLLELREGHGSYESCKGQKHYKAKGLVCTPWGVFETIRKAANHCDAFLSKAAIGKRVIGSDPDFYYKAA